MYARVSAETAAEIALRSSPSFVEEVSYHEGNVESIALHSVGASASDEHQVHVPWKTDRRLQLSRGAGRAPSLPSLPVITARFSSEPHRTVYGHERIADGRQVGGRVKGLSKPPLGPSLGREHGHVQGHQPRDPLGHVRVHQVLRQRHRNVLELPSRRHLPSGLEHENRKGGGLALYRRRSLDNHNGLSPRMHPRDGIVAERLAGEQTSSWRVRVLHCQHPVGRVEAEDRVARRPVARRQNQGKRVNSTSSDHLIGGPSTVYDPSTHKRRKWRAGEERRCHREWWKPSDLGAVAVQEQRGTRSVVHDPETSRIPPHASRTRELAGPSTRSADVGEAPSARVEPGKDSVLALKDVNGALVIDCQISHVGERILPRDAPDPQIPGG